MKKHLTLSERAIIEKCIAQDLSFASIAWKLERSPSTISREVLYVCTGCPSIKRCIKNHPYYTAIRADALSRKELSSSRQGFHTSHEELQRISDIISPLIKRGQSLNHIYATHRDEIGVSERTLYNYIDSSAFAVRNVDLQKRLCTVIDAKRKFLPVWNIIIDKDVLTPILAHSWKCILIRP